MDVHLRTLPIFGPNSNWDYFELQLEWRTEMTPLLELHFVSPQLNSLENY